MNRVLSTRSSPRVGNDLSGEQARRTPFVSWTPFWKCVRALFSTAAICLVALAARSPAASASEVSREYQVKAVCLWRLAQFVTWPTNAFENPNSPLVIGVLGENPFGDLLQAAVAGETAHGRSLVVQYFRAVDQIKTCHILYIGGFETSRLKQVMAQLSGRNVLTVTETEGLGMVELITQQNKVRLRINLKAATAAQLVLDSRLLRAAETVRLD